METERNQANIAVSSMDYALAWSELMGFVRACLKYNTPPSMDYETVDVIRHKMVELMEEYRLPQPE
jgi:hypothetical protein